MTTHNPLPLSNSQFPANTSHTEDEIDLLELFGTLWRQKIKIAVVMTLTTLVAGIYAFTAEEVWTSKAKFDQPRLEEINNYYTVTQQLKRILQSPTIGDISLEPQKIIEDVYTEFTKQIDSDDLREEFWLGSDYYAKKIKTTEKEKVLKVLLDNNLKTEIADNAKIVHSSISLRADSAPAAKKLLNEYIRKINNEVWRNKKSELNISIEQLKADLSAEKKHIEFLAITENKNEIRESKKARNIAEKANIKDFNANTIQGNVNVINKTDMLFFLGTKSLDAKINNLIKLPPTLPVRYYQIEKTLSELEALPQLKTQDIKSYRFLMSPSEPMTKDKPKKALLLGLGALLGCMLGVVLVLLQQALNQKKMLERSL